MATQVWRGIRQPSAAADGQHGIMRTRDLLGVGEIDIDLDDEPQRISLPLSGWEKRLDMKSGKVYFHNCNAKENTAQSPATAVRDLNFPPSPLSFSVGDSAAMKDGSPKFCELEWLCRVAGERIEDAAVRPLEELNFMGKAGSIKDNSTVSSVDVESRGESEGRLNLHLSNYEGACEWQSVCTLDKVKMALKRAQKDSAKRKSSTAEIAEGKARSGDGSPSVSSSSCSQGEGEGEGEGSSGAAALQAAGCPRCLVYVLLSKSNPKCPRCGYFILVNRDLSPFKRPRLREDPSHVKPASSLPFDLNSLI